jgi:hypothetical protein
MPRIPAVIEDQLLQPLQFTWYRIADPPILYRALELGDRRFAWTVPPFAHPRTGAMLPQHFALTLGRSPEGEWRVVDTKPFESAGQAEGWARGLWRDAARALRRSAGAAAGPEA